MKDHWWWRPGWAPGRRFYTWHLTFDGEEEVHRYMAAYRDALRGLDGLDLVPDQWLHLTMQGLNFTDETSEDDVKAIVDRATARLRTAPAFEVTFRAMHVTPEAVEVFAEPAEPVATVRTLIRDAIGDVWPEVPEKAEGFAPHITVAYSNSDGPAAPVRDAVRAVDAPPATARITSAQLIVLGRDNRMYEWAPYADIPLG